MPDTIRRSRSYGQRRRLRGIGGFLAVAAFLAAVAPWPAAAAAAGAVAGGTGADRAPQHRSARDRLSCSGLRRRSVCCRDCNPAGAHAQPRRATGRRGRATRLRDCATKSIGPTQSSFPSLRSSSIGRRDRTSRRSRVIWRRSAYRRRIGCSHSAAGSIRAKPAPWTAAVDALRDRGEAFSMTLATLAGHPVEVQGRAIGGRAVLRLKDASGIKRELVELVARYERQSAELAALRALAEKMPAPVWARNAAGHLTFVNAAYARAVEAKTPADAIERGLELLDGTARDSIARQRAAGGLYTGRLRAVVAGARQIFDVLDVSTEAGSAGIGVDATEVETLRAALDPACRRAPPHARSTFYRRRHVRRRSPPDVLQCRLPRAVGPRRRSARSGPDRFGGDRDLARGAQAAGGAGFPPMESAPARGLPRRRSHGAYLASARRTDVTGGDDAQSRRRRHLYLP